jgi:hypothetical protein
MKNISLVVCHAFAALLVFTSTRVDGALVDSFSDLNDTVNPTWAHLSGLWFSNGQTWDASSGQYRLRAPFNGLSIGGGQGGFVGSYVAPASTNFTVAADFVNFPTANGQELFGVATRLNGNNGFNALTGYGYAYVPSRASSQGEMVLYRIVGAAFIDFYDLLFDFDTPSYVIGSQQVTLDPNKDYKFVLDASGTQLHGQVYEIGGGLVADQYGNDATYATGFGGVYGIGNTLLGDTSGVDFTIDNFSITTVPEPAASLLCGLASLLCMLGASCVCLIRRHRRIS